MTCLALFSDSHGRMDKMEKAALAAAGCDVFCHMGDTATDAEHMARTGGKKLYSVRGNCDFLSAAPEEAVFTWEGYKILLCHGHRYGVKQSLTRLSFRAQAAGADIVLYGHTHVPRVDRDGPILFVNPGALQDGRWAILEFRPNGPAPVMKIL